MKSRLVMLMALAIAALSVVLGAGRLNYLFSSPPRFAHAPLPTKPASYLGVFEPGAPPSYDPVSDFAQAAGRRPDLAGYFSGWAEAFNTSFAKTLYAHGVHPYVLIDPTDASVADIAAGVYDGYLREFADSVRDFGHAVVIAFGHEMNAPWYPWGYGHVPPATFVAAWQHVVNLFRGQGADNVTWIWTIQADQARTGPIKSWWPGPKYVDWVGIDGFYYQPSDTFGSVFGQTIQQVRKFTADSILLSETAVGPEAGQTLKILDLFRGMARYKTLGLVWFDIDQHAGLYHQDWRIEGNAAAEYSFRLGVGSLAPANPQR
jgi:mannan endo-1,4-beta-mannosidase